MTFQEAEMHQQAGNKVQTQHSLPREILFSSCREWKLSSPSKAEAKRGAGEVHYAVKYRASRKSYAVHEPASHYRTTG